MDQTEHKKVLRMISFAFNFVDFRVLDNQGSLSITVGGFLIGVPAGVDGLPGLCDWELGGGVGWKRVLLISLCCKPQICEEQFLCWKCGHPTSYENLAGCFVAGLPLCCWVQDVMVGNVVVLGAWLLEGFGSVCCFIYDKLFLKKFSFSVLNLGLLLCSSWWTPSPGCWLVWCGWGAAWSLGSVELGWHRNRFYQNVVSHLVTRHPSILVVFLTGTASSFCQCRQ